MDALTTFTLPTATVRCYTCGQTAQITVPLLFLRINRRTARATVPIGLPCGHMNSPMLYRSDNPDTIWPIPYDPKLGDLAPGFEAYQGDNFAAYAVPAGTFLGEVTAIHTGDARRQFEERWTSQGEQDALTLLHKDRVLILLRQY